MLRVENVKVYGFEEAVRGARNSYNSWGKSDSFWRKRYSDFSEEFILGKNDLDMLKRLANAGDASHRKALRAVSVWMDVTGPLYWWKQMDQYKVGTTSLSTSTMHKITEKEFTVDDFSYEKMSDGMFATLTALVMDLNNSRERYLKTNEKQAWWDIIQILPSSYNQRRTLSMNYENVLTILKQRKKHKLDEWEEYRNELMRLPYMGELYNE